MELERSFACDGFGSLAARCRFTEVVHTRDRLMVAYLAVSIIAVVGSNSSTSCWARSQ